MQIIVESRDADGAQMRELSVQRVRFALRRLSSYVPRAKVQFTDVNGPRAALTNAARWNSAPPKRAPWSSPRWQVTGAPRWTDPWAVPPGF